MPLGKSEKSLKRQTAPSMRSRECLSGVLGVIKGMFEVLFPARHVVANSETKALALARRASVAKVKRSAGRLEKMVEDIKADRGQFDD